ncbi:MAG: Gfo/Idh/MocA family oxidoreductase [bacterium]
MANKQDSNNEIRVAVVGVGQLGQHHARLYSEMPGIKLVGVVDEDIKRAKKIAKQCKTEAYNNYRDMDGKVDAVNIAVPTALHFSIGSFFLKKGIHCLVEKPITPSLEQAKGLLDIARSRKLILQVGHIERFNPAVTEAQKYIENPRFIEANRLGPYSPRTSDVSVVLDLMIHDIEIILYLVNSPLETIDAIGARVLSPSEDIANARLKFANGCVANVSASRISIEKFRKIRIFQENNYISLDYAKPSVKIYSKKKEVINSFKDIRIQHPRLTKINALGEEIKHFIDCVRQQRTPIVSGERGRDALEVCLEILKTIQRENKR